MNETRVGISLIRKNEQNMKYNTWAKDIPEMDGVQKFGDVNHS